MKKIKIKISPNSVPAEIFKKYMAEKAAIKEAVTSGNLSTYVKQNGIKFDSPLSTDK